MKIIAGAIKGLQLEAPKGSMTRPTPARVRESLMNIIAQALPNAHFLDLYAGTGAVGIEALSRGAASCTFIEPEGKILQKNILLARDRLNKQNIAFNFMHLKQKTEQALTNRKLQSFDIIWADPPYAITLSELENSNPAC